MKTVILVHGEKAKKVAPELADEINAATINLDAAWNAIASRSQKEAVNALRLFGIYMDSLPNDKNKRKEIIASKLETNEGVLDNIVRSIDSIRKVDNIVIYPIRTYFLPIRISQVEEYAMFIVKAGKSNLKLEGIDIEYNSIAYIKLLIKQRRS